MNGYSGGLKYAKEQGEYNGASIWDHEGKYFATYDSVVGSYKKRGYDKTVDSRTKEALPALIDRAQWPSAGESGGAVVGSMVGAALLCGGGIFYFTKKRVPGDPKTDALVFGGITFVFAMIILVAALTTHQWLQVAIILPLCLTATCIIGGFVYKSRQDLSKGMAV